MRRTHGCLRHRWRALLLVAMSLAASRGLPQQHVHGAPSPAPSTPAQPGAAPLYTQDDLLFLTHMIMHHEQALEMAALVPSRSHREEFVRFARYVDAAQRVEIDQMKSLLSMATDRGIPLPQHQMLADPPMTGMLSKAQMAALAAASGAQFDELWLQGMIYHHEGALTMAREQQQRQFETGRQPFGIDVLADNILDTQRGEITKMKGWLRQWGLTGP
jgi:uncharacterized protein (DUF305 family)